MSDDFEEESSESYGKELAKSVTTSVAGAAAMVIGLYAGSVAVDKIKKLVAARQEQKDAEESTE